MVSRSWFRTGLLTLVYACAVLFVDPRPVSADTPDQKPEPSPAEIDEEFFELIKLFSDTLDQVERNYVEEISRRELMEAAIEGVLGKLDQYSNYIPPSDFDGFKTGVENQFGGIGIRVGVVDGQLTVITPLIGTPAYEAGVLAGDKIVAIAGESTKDLSLEDAIARMKGKVNTDVELTVRHAGDDKEEKFKLTRRIVQIETVLGDSRNKDDSWNYVFDADAKIAYIRVTSFSRRTHQDLQRVLRRLKTDGIKALILDLRFNPGGLLTSAIDVADLFLEGGTIVSTDGRNAPKRTWKAKKRGTFDDFEMAVLVNRFSASASEIVAASLQDHERAVIVGERTWGKGSVQNIIELEGGKSALRLTTGTYHRPNGKNIHRFEGATDDDDWGVRPSDGHALRLSPIETRRLLDYQQNVNVLGAARDEEDPDKKRMVDRQLQRALDHLNEKIAKR
jgi:carboxyl-terminal processing protease